MNILITGASSGIGAELVKRYSSSENKIFAVARDLVKLKKLKSRYINIEIFAKDLSNLDIAKSLGDELADIDLDLIIFNAGISLGHNSKNFTSSVEFQNLFNINFLSIQFILEPLIPNLQRRESGKIVFISSLASIITMPSSIAYSSSKRAINSYAEGLRFFLKPFKIKVINILPGFIETPLTDKNIFKMPFLMRLEDGVDRIEYAINRDIYLYKFPKRFYFLITIISLLPKQLKDFIIMRNRK